MDVYDIWCDLKPGVSDVQFLGKLAPFLDHLKVTGHIESWRLLRCKLGLRPESFTEWHIMIETRDLAQLDLAFHSAAARKGETDRLHFEANALVTNLRFALYRDFPDDVRDLTRPEGEANG